MLEKAVYSIIVFALLVLFHELGHFTLAKIAGVYVYEFSIGFGPRLAGFKIKETSYNLRIVPLGGFVRMAGMDPEEDKREAAKRAGIEYEEDKEGVDENQEPVIIDPEGAFINKTVPKRMAIIAAGPLMNFFLAIILFAATFLFYGMPSNKNVVGSVIEGRPAAQAGVKEGDVIQRINGTKVSTWEEVTKIIHSKPGEKISLEIKRGQQTRKIDVVTEKDPETNWGKIGIAYVTERLGLFESLKLGTIKTYEVIKLTGYFIGQMINKEMPVQLSGPVRITYEIGKAAEMGLLFLMNFAGFLSIQIGLFNLLPIPALDGSRLIFLGVEGIRGTPVDPSKENFIHMVGLALLLLLMVVITYQDIVQMFG